MSKTINGVSYGTDQLWVQFSEWLEKDAEAVAVFDGERPVSRIEISRRSIALADQLEMQGIGTGHRILFDSYSTVDTVVIGLALTKLGAVLCPINPKIGSRDRQIIIEKLGPAAIFSRYNEQGTTELVGMEEPMFASWNSTPLIESSSEEEPTALIGFTSGTTGVPKAVPHTVTSLNYAARACSNIVGLEPGDSIIGISPLTSAAGWTFPIHMGLTLGYPIVLMRKWDPKRALELMHSHRCAWGMCVPTHLLLMLEVVQTGKWDRHIHSVKALSVGGSPNSEEMVKNAEKLLGVQVLRMYGMSECLGHASMRLTDPPERRRIYDGVPFPGTHVEAYDDKDQILPRGQIGQAGVKGPSLFKGYLQGLGGDQNKFTKDNAFLTGDLITRDEEGFVKVVGRIKDQIIRGGAKIDAAEVEVAVNSHPDVVEAVVIGREDELLGERICAVVSLRSDNTLSLEELCKYLKEKGLAKTKLPEFLEIISTLPKTDFGKVDKKTVKEMVAERNH
ncbi:class I adenylate-forming enzyme family protein [Alteribacillus sp. YIM 98480]|uniref:class I adenylate-forming enzyme family protein n=1 Tax=Alteribacillus sp. YIM 98480 TaxID=2606599 RepID=UPI00131C2EE7|nr:class I adenylate-forming enzyme family protein [Alteribacillus sp. YIM 98480]